MSRNRDVAMNGAVGYVHGHTLEELALLLSDVWPEVRGTPRLIQVRDQGLSNVNIMGEVDSIRFVLKLPWVTGPSDMNRYLLLSEVSTHVSEHNLGPRALAQGNLRDAAHTPFIVLEHIDGMMIRSLGEVTAEQALALRSALDEFWTLTPSSARTHDSPHAYVERLLRALPSCPAESGELSGLVDGFADMRNDLFRLCSDIEQWSGRLMHGDLHEGNIVFTRNGVRFLDLEECAYGEPMVDIAYLRVQNPSSHPAELMQETVGLVDMGAAHQYEPLALAFALSWTIEKLVALDSGLVEASLAERYPRKDMFDYTRVKLEELRTHL